MSDGITDRIKSFVLGIVLPLVLLYLAVPYMTGDCLRTRKGNILTPVHALGYGLSYLSWGLCIHAFFYHRYENHTGIKWAIVAAGVISYVAGLYLEF
jgi:hypothetical protein